MRFCDVGLICGDLLWNLRLLPTFSAHVICILLCMFFVILFSFGCEDVVGCGVFCEFDWRFDSIILSCVVIVS